jgi:hypothetical protein
MTLLGFIFGGIPEGILGLFLFLWASIWATRKVIANLEGAAVPAWLAFIWLVPCLGAVLALVAVKKKPPVTIRVEGAGDGNGNGPVPPPPSRLA